MKTKLMGLLLYVFLAACAQQTPVSGLFASDIAVTKNPYEIAPLTAEAVFKTVVPAKVSVEVLGEEPVTHEFTELTTEHRLPILGLYPNAKNRVILTVTSQDGKVDEDTFTVTTESVPDFFPDIEVTTVDQAHMEPGWNFSQYSINESKQPAQGEEEIQRQLRSLPFMFDSNGDIRYYLDLTFLGGVPYEVGRLRNGNWIFGRGAMVYEYDVLGREVNRWPIPGYTAHHDITEKPNGNLLIAVHKAGTKNKDGSATDGDHIIELERSNGTIVNEWDLRAVADVYRRDLVDNTVDWFHMNAVWYDAADDTLIVSGRNQGVFKLTNDNELLWILAPHKGWGRAGVNADGPETATSLLTAVDADGKPYAEEVQQGLADTPDFGWVWGQHAPLILPNGHLFVFDNGFNRNFVPNQTAPYSRGVEYAIDGETKTVQQVWEYGKERGTAYFSPIISDVDYLPETENRLIMPGIVQMEGGAGAFVTEVSYPAGTVVFDATIRFKGLFETETFGGEIIYRSERLPVYPVATTD